MNITFTKLASLDQHIQYLEETLGLEGFFIVGGVVRDLIIGRSTEILDVDLTMAGKPNDIWEKIKAKSAKSTEKTEDEFKDAGFNLFRTEKFGTMTIIKKQETRNKKQEPDTENGIKYEITPFREESGYSDMRHPDTIIWSNDLLADAGRRDFTINAMYYSKLPATSYQLPAAGKDHNKLETGSWELVASLKNNGWAVQDGVLIIQNHELIASLLPGGMFSGQTYERFITESMIEDHISGIIRDPYKGLQDIIEGRIRCVGAADKRFNEDPLRILRAIRFQNTLNFDDLLDVEFDFEKETWKGMKKYYYLVRSLSKERIHEEVKKVFSGPNPFGYVAVLDELNLLKYIFPHIVGIKNLIQPVRYHPFDVYSHTLLALHHLQSINSNYLVRLAMLYHDVGKAEQYYTHTFGLENDDRSYIYGGRLNHVNCGQDMAKEDLEKIGFSNKEIAEVMRYVGWHMKPGEILMSKPENWKKKLRELYADGGYEKVRNLLDVCKGDRSGHYNPIQKSAIAEVNHLYDILDNLKNSEGQFTMSKMAVNGDDLMKEFDLKPGKKIGELMKKAYQWVMEDAKKRNDKTKIIRFLNS